MLGRHVDGLAVVECAIEARNTAVNDDRFEVDPLDHMTAQREARAAGLEVLGAWHSHPRGPARPSERDVREALPGWVHVVVDASSGAWLAWSLGAEGRGMDLVRILGGGR